MQLAGGRVGSKIKIRLISGELPFLLWQPVFSVLLVEKGTLGEGAETAFSIRGRRCNFS